ncbi:hypothetical protein SDC9_106795 [bioreactor metagenome]|uniref:Uncharacterized protein n=1 Tax=bioreactor metagenome TaxID=1076179 RepID=A0A645B3E8_9ZZZZ
MKHLIKLFQPSHGAQFFQDALFIIRAQYDVLRDIVGDISGLGTGQHVDHHVGGQSWREVGELRKELISVAHQRLGA